ncbi:purine nucleoside permease [Streptomyces sp. B1866]|uniref:purine-nucleoside phosphorylase n=1 Tax=Streptomyces sp. B1866 TaxID=3075431 RepID=UPI00288CBCF2|nr:purine nucleoside permease [Streptomyces sp. B1866]MDT3398415.1 purine nucleoside permease [Streptomyces sp. B1866]
MRRTPTRIRSRAAVAAAAVLAAVAALLTTGPLTEASGTDGNSGTGGRVRVRALVLTMFDGETKPWFDRERLPLTIEVPGAYAPVRCAASGLCVTTTGQGKANTAASVTAILDSDRLDLRRAYFLTSGIAGTPPENGTLGFAAWARWVVDYDLGHHVTTETDPTVPHGYLKDEDTGTNVFRLDDRLVDTAYRLTRRLKLADSEAAAENRAHYPGQAGKTPYVTVCDTVTGDNYWTGADQSRRAQYITGLWTGGRGDYCTTQMEDNATAAVLARHGHLSRYLSLRTASDFDQPYQGQSAQEVVTRFPGYGISVENAYRVTARVAHHLAARAS